MSGSQQGQPIGGFTPEEDREHEEGFAAIRAGLDEGLDFTAACTRIAAADPDLRRIIADDYLKVTIAQRHFQGGESTEAVAALLRLPVERIEYARREMLAEVAASAVEVFRRQSGQTAES